MIKPLRNGLLKTTVLIALLAWLIPTNLVGQAEATVTLTKTANVADYDEITDVITYTFSLAHATGTVVTGITVTDDHLGVLSGPTGDGGFAGTLEPGETWVYTVAYNVTQPDIDAGSISNTATVNGSSFNGRPVFATSNTVTVNAIQTPGFTIEKTDLGSGVVTDVGDVINYAVVLTNTGNVTVSDWGGVDYPPGSGSLSIQHPPTETVLNDYILQVGETITWQVFYTVSNMDYLIHLPLVNEVVFTSSIWGLYSQDTANTLIISDNADLNNLTVSGDLGDQDCFTTDGSDIPVTQTGPNSFEITLPDLASGVVPIDIDFDIETWASSVPSAIDTHVFTIGDPVYQIAVTAEDGTTIKIYDLVVNWTTTNPNKQLTDFWFEIVGSNGCENEFIATIDEVSKQGEVHVPYGLDITNLVAFFTLDDPITSTMTHSEDAAQPMVSGGSPPLDYSTPVAFTVHANDCSTVEYFMTVVVDDNMCNKIESLQFESTFDSCYENDIPVDITLLNTDFTTNDWAIEVPYGTDLTDLGVDLTFTQLIEDGCESPCNWIVEYLWPSIPVTPFTVTITATAPNGISQNIYNLTVTEGPASTEHLLTSFWFEIGGELYEGSIDEDTHRVDVVVPYGVVLENTLAACFEVSEHACFYINGPGATDFLLQESCVTINDFSEPRHFTVVAQDGVSEDNYNVVVSYIDAQTENWLDEMTISGLTNCFNEPLDPVITLDEYTYTIRLREGMDEGTPLNVFFLIPDLATSAPASPAVVSFTTDEEEFDITVTAQDGTPMVYTLLADFVTPSTNKAITEFSFEPYDAGAGNMQFGDFAYMGTIDEDAKTVTVHVPFGTDVTILVASFILDDMYAAMTHSEENSDLQVVQESGMSLLDYTTPVAFTVYDETCATVEYFVTVIIDENTGNEIESLTLDGMENAACQCGDSGEIVGMVGFEELDITVTVPYGTDLSTVVLDAELADGATSSPTFPITGYSSPIDVEVTAEDGLAKKTYTVTVERDDPLEGNDLITFGFTQEYNPSLELVEIWGVIDQVKHRIDVLVPYGTPVATLYASFTNSPMSCVYINGPEITDQTDQCSGMTMNDFSTDLTYTVIAQNGDESYYNVYVEVLPPDTDNSLTDLMVNGLPECFGDYTYDVTGMMDDMDITISVKTGTDLTAVDVSFDIPVKATVYPMPGVWDLTNPVTVTVTAQNGDEAVYTVTAVEFTPSSDKMITAYSIDGVSGTINQADKMIEVWMPWEYRNNLSALVATFTLSDGAKMTHSEDTWILQESGYTANDFTTPVAYTVWAEDCTTLEYFVIVHVIPNTETGISQFGIEYDGCGCDLGVKIDEYAKRVYVRIPYANADGSLVSLSSITPVIIGIAEGASVSPAAGVAKNFANGPVDYVVTAPDGVTKTTWTVLVENPPCQGTDILTWNLNSGKQVGDAIIDVDTHSIIVTVEPGTDISALTYSLTMDCGATICCNAGACAGQVIDFSDGDNCNVCVVTAQDKSATQDWTVCVRFDDVTPPDVFTNSVLVQNCDDETVDVWASEAGTIYIIADSMLDDFTSADQLDDIVENHYGASADYPYADSIVSVNATGLYKGKYYAFAVDSAGNVSCASEEAFYIDICVVEVANLCDLRAGSEVYEYVVTGEVFVTYEEGNFKFIQDDCGIKVIDETGAWSAAYGRGQGLTNIKGTIDKSGDEYKFYPVCCYSPEKSSSGNVIAPVMLSWDDFVANCYSHGRGYESMLVQISDPMLAFDDYSSANTDWVYNFYDLATVDARGNYEWFIQQVFNANYIGDEIPTEPTVYQGIRTNVNWGAIYGLITPRDRNDIIAVNSGILIADPNPASIDGILPGLCGTVTIDIINQGVGDLVISALYLNDAAGTDEFELIDPELIPFTLGTWDSQSVEVQFCPNDVGDESTTLLVEYGTGKVIEIPINGTTAVIYDMDYCQDFNDSPTGDALPSGGWTGDSPYNSSVYISNVPGWFPTVDGTRMLYMRNRQGGRPPVELVSPGINVTGTDPVVTWTEISYTGFNGGGNSSPRNLYISTDGISWTLVDSYLTSQMPDAANGDDYRTQAYSLTDYVGQTIWWKFELISDNNDQYIYWALDNFCVQERITEPILTHAPEPVDLGGVQVNESAVQTVNFMNIGVSVAKVKSIELIQSDGAWTLTDANTYPTEITDGDWAYAENGTDQLDVDVTFAPTDIGVSTAKLKVTWGLYEDMYYYVNLSGEGLSCATATEAFVGENWAPGQNIWFTYTAEKFQIVNINSCHPFNTVDPYEYSFDTYMYIYDDCDGNLIAENDDLEWDACPYNRASSGATLAMYEGETIKIFFPWVFDSASDDIGFYMNIEPSYPIDGDVCETAIPLTLPVVNHFGSTVEFADDYDMSPCSPFSNYMDGNDKVYTITLDVEGYLTINILGAYGSIHVLDKCPVEELEKRNCKAFASGPNGGEATKRIQAGTYYVIVSTWAPPQTVDYLLNMSFEELSTGVDGTGLGSSMKVYPNPTEGRFTVAINNAEAADMTLELVNISGQTVYRNTVKSVYSYTEEIDASLFAKGVYYLKVNDGEEVKIEKVVIQ